MELEDVQKFALKVCLKSWHENLLAFNELTTLSHRRRHLRLTLLFKSNVVVCPFQPYVLRETNYEHRHKNKVQLTVTICENKLLPQFIFPKSISE